MSYCFNVEKTTADLIKWVKDYFDTTASPDTKAVIGISGGKDSSVAAAVCVKALGKDRVVGILMPKGHFQLCLYTIGYYHLELSYGEF